MEAATRSESCNAQPKGKQGGETLQTATRDTPRTHTQSHRRRVSPSIKSPHAPVSPTLWAAALLPHNHTYLGSQQAADPSAPSVHVIPTCSTGTTHRCQQLWAPGVKDTREEGKQDPFLKRQHTLYQPSSGRLLQHPSSTRQPHSQPDSIHSQTRATVHQAPACKTKPLTQAAAWKNSKERRRGGLSSRPISRLNSGQSLCAVCCSCGRRCDSCHAAQN